MFTRSKSASIPDFVPEDEEYKYPQLGKSHTVDFIPDPISAAEIIVKTPDKVEISTNKTKKIIKRK